MKWLKRLLTSKCSKELKVYKSLYRDQLLINKRYAKVYDFIKNHESTVYTIHGSYVQLDVKNIDDIVLPVFSEEELKNVEWLLK